MRKQFRLEDTMPDGKYRGSTLKYVIDNDLSYFINRRKLVKDRKYMSLRLSPGCFNYAQPLINEFFKNKK